MDIKLYSHYDEAQVLPLYRAVGWSNYYQNPEMLQNAFAHSLCTLGAWEDGRLIGLIRAVGDGYSALLIQDILVYPEYQRRGVGSGLIQAMLTRYAHVYQIQLATDNTEKTKAFYRSQGFRSMEELGCCGFMKV